MTKHTLLLAATFLMFLVKSYGQVGGYHYHQEHYRPYGQMSKGEKKWEKRTYMGLSLPMMSADMQQHFTRDISYTNGVALPAVDTTIHIKRNSPGFGIKGGMGILAGSCFKVAKINESSMIAIDLAIAINLYHWKLGTVVFSPIDSTTDKVYWLEAGVPITLMYKSGPEVNFSEDNRVMFSAGAGIAPMVGGGGYGQAGAGGGSRMRPFVMAEVGFYGFLAAKLRAAYYPGTLRMINDPGQDQYGSTNTGKLAVIANGSGNFVFSLVLFPVAGRWGNNSD